MMIKTLTRIPFTLVAVGGLVFFTVAAALPPSAFQAAMLAAARLLIIPVYVVLLGFSVLLHFFGGPQAGPLRELVASTALVLALLPFVGADLLLHRFRTRRTAGA